GTVLRARPGESLGRRRARDRGTWWWFARRSLGVQRRTGRARRGGLPRADDLRRGPRSRLLDLRPGRGPSRTDAVRGRRGGDVLARRVAGGIEKTLIAHVGSDPRRCARPCRRRSPPRTRSRRCGVRPTRRAAHRVAVRGRASQRAESTFDVGAWLLRRARR